MNGTGAGDRLVEIELNGQQVQVACDRDSTSLADSLRRVGLTGTHLGCEQGACGACTVLVDGRSARACLVTLRQAEGSSVDTVEGLRDADGSLHPLQELFVRHAALQCGFCTPGMLMTIVGLADRREKVTRAELVDTLSGNICRCTGYVPIVAAAEDYLRSIGKWAEGA